MATTSGTVSAGITGTVTREDLADTLSIRDAMSSPIFLLIDHVPVHSTTVEWPVSSIEQPTGADGDGQSEATNITTYDYTERHRLQNIVARYHEAFRVTHMQQAVLEAALTGTELDFQAGQATLRLLRRAERNILFSKHAVSGDTRNFSGIIEWIFATGIDSGASASVGGAEVPDEYSAVAFFQAPGTVTQERILQDFQACWENDLDLTRSLAFCGGTVKRALSTFGRVYSSGTPVIQRPLSASEQRLITSFDVWENDFGALTIALHKDMRGTTSSAINRTASIKEPASSSVTRTVHGGEALLAIDPDYFQVGVLQGLERHDLGKEGPTTRGFVETAFTLKCLNPKAGYIRTGITGAA